MDVSRSRTYKSGVGGGNCAFLSQQSSLSLSLRNIFQDPKTAQAPTNSTLRQSQWLLHLSTATLLLRKKQAPNRTNPNPKSNQAGRQRVAKSSKFVHILNSQISKMSDYTENSISQPLSESLPTVVSTKE